MQSKLNSALAGILTRVPVVPVLTVGDAGRAVALAQALVDGGLGVIEITLRTRDALEAVRRIAIEVSGAVVGAGTVLEPEHGRDAVMAGARFLVSPGVTPRLIEAAERWPVAFLPGVATASEAMALSDLGYRTLKFFPAEPAGGAQALKALAGPLPHLTFCPTGGIDAARAPRYLELTNVACVGGSWVAPPDLVARGDWPAITALARSAAALRQAAARSR
jgi:2-dehydro-3-deoxyphosphogluconate aldolase/(4S)-4-hydroxy-2-oxoglutarate aldolase